MGSSYFPSPLELAQLLYVAIPFTYAALLLCVSLFTLTAATDSLCPRLLRFILLPPTVYYFWKACSSYDLFSSCFMVTGVATVACYGCFLALQFTILQLCHPNATRRPRWLMMRKDGEMVYHLNFGNFSERLFYVIDLLCSLRGTSWISDREWDWNYPQIQKHPGSSGRVTNSPRNILGRRYFLKNNLKKTIQLFILLDIFDTIVKSRTWDAQARDSDSLYTIPVWQQCIFATAVCIGTSITLNIHYTAFSTLAVWLGNNPANWPPLFYSPFQATSISDFWSNRWHWLFRHIFAQFSLPVIRFVQRLCRCEKGLSVTISRIFCAFGISTMLHLFIMYHAERWAVFKLGDGNIDRVPFWDVDVVSFFMIQPFGMIFEKCVLEVMIIDQIFPPPHQFHFTGTRRDYPEGKAGTHGATSSPYSEHVQARIRTGPPTPRWEKVLIMRIFAWTFLIWTGRWWTNKWIRSGFFDSDTKNVPLSLIRSLWYRKIVF